SPNGLAHCWFGVRASDFIRHSSFVIRHSRWTMTAKLIHWFKPAPHAPLRPPAEVERLYPVYRWRIFEAAFIAYATFYLVRNNFAPVSTEIGAALHYDKGMIGDILACTALAYGLGKLVLGYFADRSDARKYVGVAMLITAAFNFLFAATGNSWSHLFPLPLNGFVKGISAA